MSPVRFCTLPMAPHADLLEAVTVIGRSARPLAMMPLLVKDGSVVLCCPSLVRPTGFSSAAAAGPAES